MVQQSERAAEENRERRGARLAVECQRKLNTALRVSARELVRIRVTTVATGLANIEAQAQGLVGAPAQQLVQEWVKLATNLFNVGGLLGTLLTIPLAKHIGRRLMYVIYFLLSGVSVLATFGPEFAPHARLYGYFFIGLTVFGVFGSFTYYLPELFPTRLRATGSGFCYNVGLRRRDRCQRSWRHPPWRRRRLPRPPEARKDPGPSR